ncbi:MULTISPECIES: DNA helicase RecQ [unclassified Oceanispirochaeta]|uniref:DNA helicase RecQ n=1 Tax=unclassified Oceanispirochaeta TaxID=2635722 RepID=UPI000E09C2D6|nr:MULTISPECIES: DNA helicase RecQ [unclassified Oceanispirochaeta]MBF9016262.1 DNA helicase RecQ [Oceanispirochaeta sp. M2]NPD72724.1 DNA helicase RecQ [Oceanispirochaeta sp. M1]RDG31572.1 DNA helicase RecQ [Oceanispirochaeta sp. M1]
MRSLLSNIQTKKEAKKILKSVFGYSSFRDNQIDVITAIMSGKDVFTSMPTGGGKSLCYQIPGLMFDGLTVVISPLIALMKDQVDDAISKGIPAAFLNSTLKKDDISEIYSRLYRNEIKLLYLSPERLAVEGYIDRLHELKVAFFAIDEAHCLSEWGHDFRPDYLFLSQIRDNFPDVPMAAFTATATNKVQDDIIRLLKLKKPLTVRASFDRKELNYQVRPKTEVLSQISAFIKNHPEESGIVYRISRKDVEKTAAHLKKRGIKALHYHAGLNKEERTRNQELFNNDEVDVICATTAFGMGINKNNIRYVVHGDLPKSMEGYYQETGRAGRDGLDSNCVLFFGTGDIAKQNYFIDQIEDPQEQVKCKENLNSLVRFSTVNVCRRKQILEYFGEVHNGECGNCDVCNDITEKVEATVDAQKVLSAIARTNQGFGINHIIDIVWGADTEKIRARNHNELKTFGVGKDKSKKWWRGIINELIGQQAIFQDSDRYNVLCMTELGQNILYGRVDFFISETSASKEPEGPSRDDLLDRGGFKDRALIKLLKEKRTEIAQENHIPPYIIFSDKTLKDMSLLKPRNNDEFLLVSGVGEKKMEVYGPLFLPVINKYLEDN